MAEALARARAEIDRGNHNDLARAVAFEVETTQAWADEVDIDGSLDALLRADLEPGAAGPSAYLGVNRRSLPMMGCVDSGLDRGYSSVVETRLRHCGCCKRCTACLFTIGAKKTSAFGYLHTHPCESSTRCSLPLVAATATFAGRRSMVASSLLA